MSKQRRLCDGIDTGILQILQKDCRTPVGRIAAKLRVPKSTVHYRIKRLESQGIIEGYYAKVDSTKLGQDYTTITFVRAKYGPSYHENVGKKLAKLRGVKAVYFLFGENDFVVLTRSNNREDFMEKLEKMTNMQEIERTNTQVVAKTVKEDLGIYLNGCK